QCSGAFVRSPAVLCIIYSSPQVCLSLLFFRSGSLASLPCCKREMLATCVLCGGLNPPILVNLEPRTLRFRRGWHKGLENFSLLSVRLSGRSPTLLMAISAGLSIAPEPQPPIAEACGVPLGQPPHTSVRGDWSRG